MTSVSFSHGDKKETGRLGRPAPGFFPVTAPALGLLSSRALSSEATSTRNNQQNPDDQIRLNYNRLPSGRKMGSTSKDAHELTPVGTFADQVKNLECMLRVAFADDDLDEAESALITQFSEKLGVSQEQLDRIVSEVLSSLSQQAKVCPACGVTSEPDSKFCGSCGASLDAPAATVQVEFDIPQQGISIEFADSTAASFPKALDIAKQSDSYQTCKKGKKTWHLASFPPDSMLAALPLAGSLSSIRNKTVYQDGVEQPWNEMFGFTWCAKQTR